MKPLEATHNNPSLMFTTELQKLLFYILGTRLQVVKI